MKKILLVALLCMSSTAWAEADPIENILSKYGCDVCHSVDSAVVGPAFKDVAKKYKGNPSAEDNLVARVSSGGKGNWGSNPMPAMDAAKTNQKDIRRLVQYVLRQE